MEYLDSEAECEDSDNDEGTFFVPSREDLSFIDDYSSDFSDSNEEETPPNPYMDTFLRYPFQDWTPEPPPPVSYKCII